MSRLHRQLLALAAAAWLVTSYCVPGLGADDAIAVTDQSAKQFQFYAHKAGNLDAKLLSGARCQLTGKSILNWSIGKAWSGSYFIWLADGEPVLVGCYFIDASKPEYRRLCVELHTLTNKPLEPLQIDSTPKFLWKPDATKLAVLNPAGAPEVGGNARIRLRQMRELARKFSVTMYREKRISKEELRLLPQPIFRYPRAEMADGDGAIFAYVATTGTDPEFLLAVETHVMDGKVTWVVKPIRFTTRELELRSGDSVQWSAAEYDWNDLASRNTNPYGIAVEVYLETSSFEELVDIALSEK